MNIPEPPRWIPFEALPRAYGEPLGTGKLRSCPEDFQVEECLGFAPDGEGDHRLLWVRKTGANTEWTARRLAECAGVPVSTVGYAGLKDRHAITCQWFSLPRKGADAPEWSSLQEDGIEVLEEHAHRRKLKRGALVGNRFHILLRDCTVDPGRFNARLARIRAGGVPNYFGEQRFGHTQGNLYRAHALFAGAARGVSRHRRSLWLSAARSQIFNEVLAKRVRRGDWAIPRSGDRLQLAGTHSHFLAEDVDSELYARAARFDLHPTGPLWGEGEPLTRGDILDLERKTAANLTGWPEGLAAAGLRQDRRALRFAAEDLSGECLPEGIRLSFDLPAGAFATALLREVVSCIDDANPVDDSASAE